MTRKRLETWGEIASYLSKSVATAQRWERENRLPVHRFGGAKAKRSGTVFAFTDELDEWLESQLSRANVSGAEHTKSQAPTNWKRAVPFLALSIVIVVLALMLWLRPARNPVAASVESGNRFVVRDSSDRVVWTYAFQEDVLFGETRPGDRLWRFRDLDNDQLNELVLFYKRDPFGTRLAKDEIWTFDHNGTITWKYKLGRKIRWGGFDFPNHYSIWDFGIYDLAGDGNQLIVVIANHIPSFPSQVSILDREGQLVGEYWHPGYLFTHATMDVDQDGVDEIVLGGINNLEDKAACLLVVNYNGRSSLTPNARDVFEPSFKTGEFKKYLLFPRTCVAKALVVDSRVNLLRERNGYLLADVQINYGDDIQERVYNFNSELKLQRPDFPQSFVSLHHQLEREGILDHSHPDDRCLER